MLGNYSLELGRSPQPLLGSYESMDVASSVLFTRDAIFVQIVSLIH
jgi:hypothetical protein